MQKSVRAILLAAFVASQSTSAFGAGYVENWNSPVLTNHAWSYYVTNDVSLPMQWLPSGGASGGYVRAPLQSLMLWGNGYWPAFTITNPPSVAREPSQNLYLTPETLVSANVSALGSANLNGGTVNFFIGMWIDANNYGFFYHQQALTVNPDGWQNSSTLQLGGDANWVSIYQKGTPARASDIYNNPQQYGLAIFNATGQPTGFLGVDDFSSAIPEPHSLALLGLGLSVLALRRRGLSRV